MLGVDLRDVVITLLTAVIATCGFLIRKIFTSEQKINLLEQMLLQMKEERKEHDTYVDTILTELRQDIKSLLQSRPYPRPKRDEGL